MHLLEVFSFQLMRDVQRVKWTSFIVINSHWMVEFKTEIIRNYSICCAFDHLGASEQTTTPFFFLTYWTNWSSLLFINIELINNLWPANQIAKWTLMGVNKREKDSKREQHHRQQNRNTHFRYRHKHTQADFCCLTFHSLLDVIFFS